jgi:hypothetical protein
VLSSKTDSAPDGNRVFSEKTVGIEKTAAC